MTTRVAPESPLADAWPMSARTIIRAKAPLRVSFVGGGTDLPPYYEEHGGAVLSATINRHAYVTLYPRQDREVRIRSVDLGYIAKYVLDEGPEYDGVLDLVKAAVQRVGVGYGVDIDIRSDAPAGSGLGGSSALTAAVLGALTALTGAGFDPYELAELNYRVERVDLKIAGGKQDQYATTFGGLNLIEFSKDRVIVNPLRIEPDVLNDLEAHFLLCYTGCVRTDLGLVQKLMASYRQHHPDTVAALKHQHELVYEMKDALTNGDVSRVGTMLHEVYLQKKRAVPELTDGTLADRLYDNARRHGAVGGKLLGGGGGGYLLLYCETDRQQEVRRELERLGGQVTDFAFDGRGLKAWRSSAR
jgi:D-glycero-alpha-D-manno-heptose-7-phosphate kinase